jgi:hypothetical protein
MLSLQTLTLSAVLLSQICSTAAQLGRQNPKIKSIRQLRSYHEPAVTLVDSFTTFFEIVYELSPGFETPTLAEFDPVAQAIIPAYNGLIELYDDPFNRFIEAAELLSLVNRDEALIHRRKLEDLNPIIIGLIRISARCSRCRSDSRLSNEVSGRRQLATGGADKAPNSTFFPTDTNEPTSASTGDGGSTLLPGLPTEQDIQDAYENELQAQNFEFIVAVLDLNEVESPPPVPSRKKSKKSKSKKSKSKKSKSKKSKKSGNPTSGSIKRGKK